MKESKISQLAPGFRYLQTVALKSTLQHRSDLGHWARKWAILNVEASGPHFGGANDLSLMEQGYAHEERRSRSNLGSYYTAPSGAHDRST